GIGNFHGSASLCWCPETKTSCQEIARKPTCFFAQSLPFKSAKQELRSLFRKDASMGADAPTIVFIPVHCAPKKAPCPKCGKLGKRKRTCTREVRTVAFKAVAYLKITYGEYTARCQCCTTFRNTPEGVLPKAHYDNKVRDLVLDRIIKDGMSIERILESLRREFLLERKAPRLELWWRFGLDWSVVQGDDPRFSSSGSSSALHRTKYTHCWLLFLPFRQSPVLKTLIFLTLQYKATKNTGEKEGAWGKTFSPPLRGPEKQRAYEQRT